MCEVDWKSSSLTFLQKLENKEWFIPFPAKDKKEMELKGGRSKGEIDVSICDHICVHVFYLCAYISYIEFQVM